MQLTIRRAERRDADPLFDLARGLATSFTPERAVFDASLTNILAADSAQLLVAERDSHVVGYCLGFDHDTFFANGRVAWVEEMMVQADWRGQGIGRALMDAFETWARSRGSKLVALATRRAAPFYTALDYEESATYFRKLL